MNHAPVCIFVYKRLDTFEKVIESLRTNPESSESTLYIFSDAAKGEKDRESVQAVRDFARLIEGFGEVNLVERSNNHGLAKSIIAGVSEILERHGRIIVLEDDLVVSNNFLAFMNQSLDKYRGNPRVWSISGYSSQRVSQLQVKNDVFFGLRASSWGWATWKDRWERVDWAVSDFHKLNDARLRRAFKQGGGDLVTMLKRQRSGLIDSWAIRFCFYQFLNNAFDVVPKHSKVINLGFEESATNTVGMESRFYTELDRTGQRDFDLPTEIFQDEAFERAFREPFRLNVRFKYRLKNLIRIALTHARQKMLRSNLSGLTQ